MRRPPAAHLGDPELPEVGERDVERGEASVRGVLVAAHRQQAEVAQADPRYLVGREGRLGRSQTQPMSARVSFSHVWWRQIKSQC